GHCKHGGASRTSWLCHPLHCSGLTPDRHVGSSPHIAWAGVLYVPPSRGCPCKRRITSVTARRARSYRSAKSKRHTRDQAKSASGLPPPASTRLTSNPDWAPREK